MELQTLVDEVDARSAGPEAMLRLRTAVEVAAEANELADELIDHAVDRARAAGASWTQIGDVLGVSRQAAQQRQGSWLSRLFGGGRGEDERRRVLHGRFTRDARTTVVEAQHAARALGHDAIGTERLLLGILATAGSIGARALAEHHLERALVEERIAEIERDRPTGSRRRHLRFNPRARKVLELALREAVR